MVGIDLAVLEQWRRSAVPDECVRQLLHATNAFRIIARVDDVQEKQGSTGTAGRRSKDCGGTDVSRQCWSQLDVSRQRIQPQQQPLSENPSGGSV